MVDKVVGRSGGSNRHTQQGRGNGNRNFNRSSQPGNSSGKPNEKKYLFAPAAASSTTFQNPSQYATYAKTVEHICQHVQKSFTNYGHDCAKSLRDMTKLDLSKEEPIRGLVPEGSNAAERITQTIHQNGLDIKYTAEYHTHTQRVQHLDANLAKAYAIILDTYCTSTMRSRVKLHPDFHTKILDDPIELLEAIKTCTSAPVTAQYLLIKPVHDLQLLLNAKQYQTETLDEWSLRFKAHMEDAKKFIGKAALNYYVEQQQAYIDAAYKPRLGDDPLPPGAMYMDTTRQKTMKKEAWDAFEAYLFMLGCDKNKYGLFIANLQTRFSLEDDKYPKTLQKAIDALGQHPFDPKHYEVKKKEKERRNNQNAQSNNNNNNNTAQSNASSSQGTSFAQTGRSNNRNSTTEQQPGASPVRTQCHCCGEFGHISKFCPETDSIPKRDWYVRRAMQAFAEEEAADDSEDDAVSSVTS